jgi:two-component system LytT family response regulator
VHGVERMPAVVFVTAHDEFAVRAFEARALDYLVKPLGAARFDAALARVRERMRVNDALALAARLSALLESDPGRAGAAGPPRAGAAEPVRARAPGGERISVPTPTGQRLLDVSDVEWIEAADDHVEIHAAGARYRLRESLAALEARLDPAHFVRIHRAAIVRIDHVRELCCDGPTEREATVVLRDGKRLPVSRRRLAQVRALLSRS